MSGTDQGAPAPIGVAERRGRARRLVAGAGRYTDDLTAPRMLHAAFLRSPYAHARFDPVDLRPALALPGVFAAFTGADIAAACAPFLTRHALFPDLISPAQWPLAIEVARWQGEPVALVLASTRALAEDAVELLTVDWQPLDTVVDPEAALAPAAPLVHPELGTNLSLERRLGAWPERAGRGMPDLDPVEAALAGAELVVTERFVFGRHTGVPLEPRTMLAAFDAAEQRLVVHQSHQAPHQQQTLYAALLDLPEHDVRVVCPDVGGAFGIKLQFHGDEAAVAVAARLTGRPVKYTADRLESFVADVHARDHQVQVRMGFDSDGRIRALDIDDLYAIGPYSQYPRASVMEASHVLQLTAAAYTVPAYRGRARVVYTNKGMMGHYRAVGQPLGAAIGELLLDRAARALDMDPITIRRRNYVDTASAPVTTAAGLVLEDLSLVECLDRLVERMDYTTLRVEQTRLRGACRYRGIGVAGFIENTGPGPDYYGLGRVPVSAQDGCVVRLEPSGTVRVASGATDQGQGADTATAQVVAAALGLTTHDVHVTMGDSEACPYGGGAFASRGASIGLEVAWRAGKRLRTALLALAGQLLQCPPTALTLSAATVRETASGRARFTLRELAQIGHFRQHELPPDFQPQLAVVEHYVRRDRPGLIGNGIQGAHVEVDVETGLVHLLGHWVVHDCGFVVNPLLLAEQVRGGVVQGIGGALFEELIYDPQGQLLNASLAEYLVPMAAELPDIDVTHIEHPMGTDTLGSKGVGEAGTAGAMAAVLCAINDALAPFGAGLASTPCSPERILDALRRAQDGA